eukprot:TRINITY_DN6184_c0_g1_i1.p1 TRINITY_DN6184_c0_g1~~TRINITY_DN6184_c0_g1_i1.p1  ORF type:complete len:256 (+),score=57.14 TRINITY_DN6184_c0_g1_i1:358-1125(+)
MIHQKDELLKLIERSQKEHEHRIVKLKEEYELKLEERDNRVISTAKGREQELAQLKAERNNWRRKAESISKDLKKIRRTQSKGDQGEIMRMNKLIGDLQEQLDRKNKSLADAMEALGTPTIIETPSTRPQPPPPLQPHPSTLKKRRNSAFSPSETQMLFEKNRNLQTLANELSETIQGKEEVLRSLRYANHFLGNRVLELEAIIHEHLPNIDSPPNVSEEHFFDNRSITSESIRSESIQSDYTDDRKLDAHHDLP